MNIIHIDFETRSEFDISNGVWLYSKHHTTSVLCLTYAIDDEEPVIWTPIDEPPYELFDAIKKPDAVVKAHNAFFERCIWYNICHKRLNWPEMPHHKWACTLAKAAAHALPRSLSNANKTLKLDVQKDEQGKRTMLKLSKPKKQTKNDARKWHNHQSDLLALYEYNIQDVEAERALDKELLDLTPIEQQVWQLEQTINWRGIKVDKKAVDAFCNMINVYRDLLVKKQYELTNGAVKSIRQTAALKKWLNDNGVPALTVNKAEMDYWYSKNIPEKVKQIIDIRRMLSKSAVDKYFSFQASCDPDDHRLRDYLKYHGATTGRFTSQVVQLQNIAKGNIENPEEVIEFVKNNESEQGLQLLEKKYGNFFDTATACIRSMLIADEGKEFVVADYSAVEARGVMWLANDAPGLKVLGEGKDVYIDQASYLYRKTYGEIPKKGKERELGKTVILGCLAENTKVLYRSPEGVYYKNIQDLNQSIDYLWNGEKWVNFREKVCVGMKGVIKLLNTELTWNHLILTTQGWQTAEEIVLEGDMNVLRLGEYSVTGQLLAEKNTSALNVVSIAGVSAALFQALESTNYLQEKLQCALDVLIPLGRKNPEVQVNILLSLLIEEYGKDGSLATATLNLDANALIEKIIKTTGQEVSLANLQAAKNSWSILLRYLTGMFGGLQSIELIIPKDIKKETLEWCHKKKTTIIGERVCYDLVDVAEGNMFQCETFIAHNCGYAMGAPKFLATCDAKNVDLDNAITPEFLKEGFMLRMKRQNLSTEETEQIKVLCKKWTTFATTYEQKLCDLDIVGLRPGMLVAEYAVNAYRQAHSPVKEFWYSTERSAIEAVEKKGQVITNGKTKWVFEGKFLKCYLPSGRALCYPYAEVKTQQVSEKDKRLKKTLYYEYQESTKASINGWVKGSSYGGLLVENICQAVCRDIMVYAMLQCEKKGYPVVLTVHDELISEVPIGSVTVEEYEKTLCELPSWAEGFPIAAEGWIGKRYKK